MNVIITTSATTPNQRILPPIDNNNQLFKLVEDNDRISLAYVSEYSTNPSSSSSSHSSSSSSSIPPSVLAPICWCDGDEGAVFSTEIIAADDPRTDEELIADAQLNQSVSNERLKDFVNEPIILDQYGNNVRKDIWQNSGLLDNHIMINWTAGISYSVETLGDETRNLYSKVCPSHQIGFISKGGGSGFGVTRSCILDDSNYVNSDLSTDQTGQTSGSPIFSCGNFLRYAYRSLGNEGCYAATLNDSLCFKGWAFEGEWACNKHWDISARRVFMPRNPYPYALMNDITFDPVYYQWIYEYGPGDTSNSLDKSELRITPNIDEELCQVTSWTVAYSYDVYWNTDGSINRDGPDTTFTLDGDRYNTLFNLSSSARSTAIFYREPRAVQRCYCHDHTIYSTPNMFPPDDCGWMFNLKPDFIVYNKTIISTGCGNDLSEIEVFGKLEETEVYPETYDQYDSKWGNLSNPISPADAIFDRLFVPHKDPPKLFYSYKIKSNNTNKYIFSPGPDLTYENNKCIVDVPGDILVQDAGILQMLSGSNTIWPIEMQIQCPIIEDGTVIDPNYYITIGLPINIFTRTYIKFRNVL